MFALIVTIVSAVCWFVSGFFLGRTYQIKHNPWKKMAMDTLEQLQKEQTTTKELFQKIGLVKRPDGSLVSPYQVKKSDEK